MSKYQALADHLARLEADEWRPTFHEMNRMLGFELPQAARKAGWWTNEGGGHVTTWSAAGWEIDPERVDLDGEHVTFRRVRPVEETRAEAAEGLSLLEDEERDEDARAATRVHRREGSMVRVDRVASGGVVAAALVGLALGLTVIAVRSLLGGRRDD